MPEQAGMEVGSNSLTFRIATQMDHLVHVFAIRAICFMEDSSLPVDHAFDGNDIQATHVIAYDGEEPVGALRIRWFKDFAKIERSAFRKSHRSPRFLKMAAEFVFKHIARKGYSKVITHASHEYALVWRRILGFKVVADKATTFHGAPYVELIRDLSVPEDAITLASDIPTLFRTEGEWDAPAKYEAI